MADALVKHSAERVPEQADTAGFEMHSAVTNIQVADIRKAEHRKEQRAEPADSKAAVLVREPDADTA